MLSECAPNYVVFGHSFVSVCLTDFIDDGRHWNMGIIVIAEHQTSCLIGLHLWPGDWMWKHLDRHWSPEVYHSIYSISITHQLCGAASLQSQNISRLCLLYVWFLKMIRMYVGITYYRTTLKIMNSFRISCQAVLEEHANDGHHCQSSVCQLRC